jgi:leader peptidase (prepilin peptidase)/N-methyltransferase
VRVLPLAAWVIIAAILGLAVGSFLNVVIYRVPAGESLVHPPSRCPRCGTPILARHNIPVVGWLLLRGRCHSCQAPISPRYPLVEVATSGLFAAVAAAIVGKHLSPVLPAYLYLSAIGIALALIDLDHRRLPDKIVLPSYLVLAVLLAAGTATMHDHPWWSLARAAIGGLGLYVFYFGIAFAYPAGMGFGDVKLAGVLGGALGYLSWAALLVGGFAAFLLGSVIGVAAMAGGQAGRKTAIPFGPFMIAGALLAIFVATPIAHGYLHLVHH